VLSREIDTGWRVGLLQGFLIFIKCIIVWTDFIDKNLLVSLRDGSRVAARKKALLIIRGLMSGACCVLEYDST
jgi:hypothetical protein